MKKSVKRTVLIILLLIIVSGSLLYIFRVQLLKRYTPDAYLIGSVKMSVISDTTFVTAKIAIKNNVFLKINVDTIKYEVSLFEKVYMQDQTFVGLILPGNGSDTVDFMLKIPHTILLKDLKSKIGNVDSASYALDVSIQYSSVFGSSEFSFYKSSKIKLPQPPEIEVIDIKYKKIRMKSLLAFIQIKVTNHSPLTLILNDIDYFIDIPEIGSLNGNYKEPLKIKPHGTSYVTLEVELAMKNLLKTAFQILLNNDNYAYSLNIKVALESINPYQESFKIELENHGQMELKK